MAREGLAAAVTLNRGQARVVGAGHAQPAGSKPFFDAERPRRGAAKTPRRIGNRGGGDSFVAPLRAWLLLRWALARLDVQDAFFQGGDADPHVVRGDFGGVEACGLALGVAVESR